jgi:hypothetical protein
VVANTLVAGLVLWALVASLINWVEGINPSIQSKYHIEREQTMNINLIDVIVLDYEEAKSVDSMYWDILASGDYVVHAIYDETNDEIIYLNDNVHGHPDAIIGGAEVGIRCCGATMTSGELVIVLREGECSYNHTHVLRAIREAVK